MIKQKIPVDIEERVDIFFNALKDWSPPVARSMAKIGERLHYYLLEKHARYSMIIHMYYLKKKNTKEGHKYGSYNNSKKREKSFARVK